MREWHFARQQLPGQHSQRIQIAATVESIRRAFVLRINGFQLFGRHIGQAASEIGQRRRSFQILAEADVEVGQFGHAFRRQQHIRRLQIAMQDALPMSIVQCPAQLGRDPADDLSPRHPRHFLPSR